MKDNKEPHIDMTVINRYIRFDWAMKRLLRDKANFVVLEGLLSSLLDEQITIVNLLESESNQESADDKYNRVDVKAVNDKGQYFIIEVQNNSESTYFQRMLFGTSKVITDHIHRGDVYDKVVKVYSVNIVYFDLGHGTDTVYHGKTEFRGIHNNELLDIGCFEREKLNISVVSKLYPEYYILKVNNFNAVAKTHLEEWLYYLKVGDVPDNATAPGLSRVREVLKVDAMSPTERLAYERHLDNMVIIQTQIDTAKDEGIFWGKQQGRAEGLAEGKLEIGRNLKGLGIPVETIMQATGFSKEIIDAL